MPVPPEESETLAALSERLSPAGQPVEDRATVPAKLFRLVSVTVEVEVDPALTTSEVGLAETLKSGEGDVGLKNSVMGVAPASFDVSVARFQLTSIVLVSE